jgi:hypothetical protein
VRIDLSLPSIAIEEPRRAAAKGPGRSRAAPDGFRDNRVEVRRSTFDWHRMHNVDFPRRICGHRANK